MLGDNFMWDPDGVIQGETTDTYFQTKGAFEVVSFGFGMVPGDSDSSSTDGTAGSGAGAGAGGGTGAGSQQGGRSTTGMNAGLRVGVKMGGSVTRRLGGAGGVSGGVSTAGGAGGGSGSKPKFGTLTITKVVDNASTLLYQYCSTAVYIPTLNMAIRKSGGDHLLYLQYCFRHNQVTTINWDGGAGDQRPKETFTLEYKAMGMQYVAQAPAGGYTEAPLQWLWSLETGLSPEQRMTLDIGGEPPSEDFLPPIVEPPIVQEDE